MKPFYTRRIEAVCRSFAAAMIIALCIIGASANCYADDTSVLKLELGSGHETLAAAMAASPQDWLDESFLQCDAEGRAINVVRAGTAIKIILPDNYSYGGVMYKLYSSFHKALELYAEGLRAEGNNSYFFDNDKMVFCSGEYYYATMENQSTFGFRPKESYIDSSAFSQEKRSKMYDSVTESQPLYVLWNRPIKSMEVQIGIPECGEEVSLSQSDYGDKIPDNRPEVTCPEHTQLYTIRGQVDHTYWANSFSLQYGDIVDPFEGTLTGGNKYIAAAYIGADWGYYFAEDVAVTVNGEPDEPQSRRSPIWPSEYELYKYIEPEHIFDDIWVTDREATCTDKEVEACYCTACGGKKTRETNIDPDAHAWGAWTKLDDKQHQRVCGNDPEHVEKEAHSWGEGAVTTSATRAADGVRTYTCSVCGATKTAVIPARGTLIAQMKAKGSNAMELTWTMANAVDGYDIFFSPCNHKGIQTSASLVGSVNGNGTFRWQKTGLRKKTPYKAYVKAYVMENGQKQYVAASPEVHAYTSGGDKSFTNPKRVTVKKKTIKLKSGKTYKIKGKVSKLKKKKKLISKKHAPKLRYMSSDESIATVNSRGKVKALKKGICRIYVYAVNGVYKTVTVRVD